MKKNIVLFFLAFPIFSFGQVDSTRFKLLKDLTQYIYSNYLNAEIANSMCDTVNYKFSTSKYDENLNLDEFVYEVEKDLRRVSKDNHIQVIPAHYPESEIYYESELKKLGFKFGDSHNKRAKKQREKLVKKYNKRAQYDMFKYGEIKILPGNIGYLEIKEFNTTSYLKKENINRISFKSVLEFLRNTNSIIVDFRENLGGSISLSKTFCSYFSNTTNTYFITTEAIFRYDSSGVEVETRYRNKLYTDNKINNSLIAKKIIYILISKRTFSAGELSTYKLKQLHSNTTVIGEVTKGGGNGHQGEERKKYFTAVIPTVKIFDEKNFDYSLEAKGIKPDILTNSDSALSVAYSLSLSGNAETTNLTTSYFKKQEIFSNSNEEYFKKKYNDYVGYFRKIVITKENEQLFMTYDIFLKQVLIPEAVDFFVTGDFEFIRFIRNKEYRVVEIQVRHKDGYTEKFHKL